MGAGLFTVTGCGKLRSITLCHVCGIFAKSHQITLNHVSLEQLSGFVCCVHWFCSNRPQRHKTHRTWQTGEQPETGTRESNLWKMGSIFNTVERAHRIPWRRGGVPLVKLPSSKPVERTRNGTVNGSIGNAAMYFCGRTYALLCNYSIAIWPLFNSCLGCLSRKMVGGTLVDTSLSTKERLWPD